MTTLLTALLCILLSVPCYAGNRWDEFGFFRRHMEYGLRDEFGPTDRTADNVHGTASEPGPGTRTVVDTESKLSITGGALTFAGGKASPAAGDPGLWYGLTVPAIREVGRILTTHFNFSTFPSSDVGFGWDTNQSGVINEGIVILEASNWRSYSNAYDPIPGASLSTSTNYIYTNVRRSAGAYNFLKTGTGNQLLFYVSDRANSTAYRYPAISWKNGVGISNYIRVPTQTWLPTPLTYDTFTRSNGAIGSTETTGPDSQTTPALAWTSQVGTWIIASNKASSSAVTGDLAIATVTASTADVYASCIPGYGSGKAGLIVRYSDADNYVYAYHDGTNAALIKRVGGVEANLVAPAAATYGAAYVLTVDVSGTAYRLYYNNALVGTGTLDAAGINSNTKHGLYSTVTDATLDTFTLFAKGTGGEYSVLNSF